MIEDAPRVLEGLKAISNESRDFVDPKALGGPQVFYDPHSIFCKWFVSIVKFASASAS